MKREKNIKLESIKENRITLELIGDNDLVLHKKSRLFEMSEVWKQNHPRGAKMPEKFQGKNEWEQFITTITWLYPITFHDDDPSLYNKEEWESYMKNNRPCILTQAFIKSFQEAFKTFGFRESTGKAGTDLQRALNFTTPKVPVTFSRVVTESRIVPTKGKTNSSVVYNGNLFSGWSTTIEIVMPEKVFPVETVVSVVQTAGKYIGVGGRRKEGYGRYHIGSASLTEM